MDYFPGDYYGKRCQSGKKSGDVFNDYLDILNGVASDESEIKWRLPYFATAEDYESWERLMLQGFHRCDTYDQLDDDMRLHLAVRRDRKSVV